MAGKWSFHVTTRCEEALTLWQAENLPNEAEAVALAARAANAVTTRKLAPADILVVVSGPRTRRELRRRCVWD